jgi:hypothetical protein
MAQNNIASEMFLNPRLSYGLIARMPLGASCAILRRQSSVWG